MKKIGTIKLGVKFVLIFMAAGLLPLFISGVISVNKASSALSNTVYNQLNAVRDIKKNRIEQFFGACTNDMSMMVEQIDLMKKSAFDHLSTIQQMKKTELEKIFKQIEHDISQLSTNEEIFFAYHEFQTFFDSNSIYEAANESAFQNQKYASEFSTVSAKIDDMYQGLWLNHEVSFGAVVDYTTYKDLFIISADEGVILYHYGYKPGRGKPFVHLSQPPFNEEGIARAWKKVMSSNNIAIEDFSPVSQFIADDNKQIKTGKSETKVDISVGAEAKGYASGKKIEESMFVAAPVHDDAGKIIAVVALQIAGDSINALVQQREGLGISGETYLAAFDGDRIEFRSDMQTMGNGTYVIGRDLTDFAPDYLKKTLAGNSVEDLFVDSAGNPVLVVSDLVTLNENIAWAVISKKSLEEALSGKVSTDVANSAIANVTDTTNEKDYFQTYIETYQYHDFFLINNQGYLFYSAAKESDYRTNMFNGPYAESGLGKLAARVFETKEFGLSDFEPYAPSNNKPAAFIAKPLLHGDEVELIVAMQLSLDAINDIMQERSGMGKTGETYLVGNDKLMRSDTFLDSAHHSVEASFADPLTGKVDTDSVRKALSGNQGEEIITNYKGNSVLSAFAPVQIGHFTWALVGEISTSEAFSEIVSIKYLMAGVSAVTVIFLFGFALFTSRSITLPINKGVNLAKYLSDGDLTKTIDVKREDEIGTLARALNEVSSNLRHMFGDIATGVNTLTSSSTELSAISQQMTSSSEQTADRSNTVASAVEEMSSGMLSMASAAEEATSNVQMIAAAIEEMSASIKEIADNTTSGSRTTENAVKKNSNCITKCDGPWPGRR
ncbi:putative Protein with methyl-accepting chemotaxis protein (MCP) signaling domain [Desulfamplus magnetovallimortis]|uniref:HAMP domain-containing protein n=1 Tax=Desulfamplus magnetovallimortis TaxID=1246637 RepID=A0A1W1HF26_9BACT|nr:cache domain-containing protein [Desulfamplus magnetovallimortis]SLM31094.1 putative Protein with methyl-accepting chemotaxis protein (MCP) signaling domain [Desulfamplus magnetovallimortis]